MTNPQMCEAAVICGFVVWIAADTLYRRGRINGFKAGYRKARQEQVMEITRLAQEDRCPMCLGGLDTGWECNSCGYDAAPWIAASPSTKIREGVR